MKKQGAPVWLVFGGGKFGVHLFDHAPKGAKLVFIDRDPDSQVATQKILPQNTFKSREHAEYLTSIRDNAEPIFIQGKFNTFFRVWQEIKPDWLIPMVPIHVMKEFMIKIIYRLDPDVIVKLRRLDLPKSAPNELNVIRGNASTIYLSYAPPGELCPQACPGKPGYCAFHQKNKPITVTDFVSENYTTHPLFLFESVQLAPGYGGIPLKDITPQIQRIKKLLENRKWESYPATVATTCNCHGVISGLEITI
jgi:hypothetical protein